MIEDIGEVMKAQIVEQPLVQRQVQSHERTQPPARGSTSLLLASPFDKLPQQAGKVVQSHGYGITLAPGMQSVPSLPTPQEPDLWMSGLATVLGMAVLLAALRSVWE